MSKLAPSSRLTPACSSPHANRKPRRVWRGRSSCRWSVSYETKPRSPNTVWHVETQSRSACHTAGFVGLHADRQKRSIPLMSFPRFHLPQAKSAYTMEVSNRKLIRPSCFLLHMAASQATIYKEYNEKKKGGGKKFTRSGVK